MVNLDISKYYEATTQQQETPEMFTHNSVERIDYCDNQSDQRRTTDLHENINANSQTAAIETRVKIPMNSSRPLRNDKLDRSEQSAIEWHDYGLQLAHQSSIKYIISSAKLN